MKLKVQKRLAARVANVSIDRIKFDEEKLKEIKDAITRADIKELIKKGVIKIIPKKRPSRVRARARHKQKKKGRRRGQGKRKGKAGARTPKKRQWINKIRALRKTLSELKKAGKISNSTYKEMRAKAKGGFFRSTSHLMFYLKQNNLLKK